MSKADGFAPHQVRAQDAIDDGCDDSVMDVALYDEACLCSSVVADMGCYVER